jgi:hypothetical protein
MAQIYRIAAHDDYKKMLEANIAIFNGAKINNVEKEYKNETSGISYFVSLPVN